MRQSKPRKVRKRLARLGEPITEDIVPRFTRAAMLFAEVARYMQSNSRVPNNLLTVREVMEEAFVVATERLTAIAGHNVPQQNQSGTKPEPINVQKQLVEDAAYVGRLVNALRKEGQK